MTDIKTKPTPEQKKKLLEEKIKKMKLRVKELDSVEKRKERKDRARELIQIGAIVSQFHDRKKLLEYLKSTPQFIFINEVGETKKTKNQNDTKGRKMAIFIDPNIV
jgi:predicted aconitase